MLGTEYLLYKAPYSTLPASYKNELAGSSQKQMEMSIMLIFTIKALKAMIPSLPSSKCLCDDPSVCTTCSRTTVEL